MTDTPDMEPSETSSSGATAEELSRWDKVCRVWLLATVLGYVLSLAATQYASSIPIPAQDACRQHPATAQALKIAVVLLGVSGASALIGVFNASGYRWWFLGALSLFIVVGLLWIVALLGAAYTCPGSG